MQKLRPLTLNELVREMKALGDVLVPYNFPQAKMDMGDDLGIFKAREAVIDGYSLFLHYQKSDYESYFAETLQIHNLKSPFLPFSLVSKLGRRFLGSQELALVELFRDNRKIYVWCAYRDKDNQPISPENDHMEECDFEGFKYYYLQPSQVDIL